MVLAWALAAVVLVTGPGARRDRLLALLLFVEGLSWGTGSGFLYLVESAKVAWVLQAIFTSAFIALPACYLAFIGTLPTPLARPLRSRAGLAALVAATLAAEAFWLTHRELFIAGMVPAWYGIWDAKLTTATVWSLNLFGAVDVMALVTSLSAWRRAAPGSPARKQASAFAVAFGVHDVGLFVFTLLLPGHLVPPPPSGRTSDLVIIAGADCTTIAFVLLVSYGILKVQLFDIDLRIKVGLRRSTVAAIFMAAFLVVEQIVQLYLAGLGLLIGGLTAGLLVFFLDPIHRFAESLAHTAMPKVSATPEYLAWRKLEVYRAALEGLYQDGVISDKERVTLERLRIKLGIEAADAMAIEGTVRAAPA